RGFRAATGIGAVGLLTAGLTMGVLPVVAGAQVKPHATKFLACMVTDVGGINDKSFNYSAYQGLLGAQKVVGASHMGYDLVQTPPNGGVGYPKEISTLLSKHCGIIVTVGFLMDAATGAAASAHESQRFAIVDDTPSSTSKELLSLTYATNQDAFLGGALSAAESKTHVVATYGGVKIPPVTIYMDGFVAGVRWYDKTYRKHVKVLGWIPQKPRNYKDGLYDGTGVFTNSFTDQSAGKADTSTFFAEKADIVFPVAGSVGLGSVAAAVSAGKGHYVDGVDTDGCISEPTDCKYFPMSVTKGITVSVRTAILAAYHNTFKGGVYLGTFKNNGATLVVDKKSISETASEKTMISNATKGIEKGTITVGPNTYPKTP